MDCHSFLCAMSQDKNIVVWQLYHSNQIVSYQICGVLDTEREVRFKLFLNMRLKFIQGKLIDVNSLKEFYFDSSTLFITGINTDRDIFRWDLRPAIDDSAHSSKQSVAGNRPKSSAFRRKSRYYRSEYVKIPLVQFSKSIRSSTKLHGVSFVAGVTSESLWIASSVKGPIVSFKYTKTGSINTKSGGNLSLGNCSNLALQHRLEKTEIGTKMYRIELNNISTIVPVGFAD